MSNVIYIINSCNQWKEYASMRLIAASTKLETIINIINRQIRAGNMFYMSEEYSRKEQIRRLKFDLTCEGGDYVFEHLLYGHVAMVSDGEVQ